MHRQETITGLKKFNARRKLKAAMHTAMIITKKSSSFCEFLYFSTGSCVEITRQLNLMCVYYVACNYCEFGLLYLQLKLPAVPAASSRQLQLLMKIMVCS